MTNEIQKTLICGIGAVGSIYADLISRYDNNNLKVLVDKQRLENYTKSPKIFNNTPLKLNYVLPTNTDFKADLIIIATKIDGLSESIKNIKNFVKEDTIILSLLNGISSEEEISKVYGWKHLPLAYFIGHSAMRKGNIITFDGVGDIVFGIKAPDITDENDIEKLKDFFDKVGISYKTPNDMLRAYWLKFMLNISSNQPSAILKMTFGQMQNNPKFIKLQKNIINEVITIAKAEGVNTENMLQDAMQDFFKMLPDGKTSMLQDIEAKRKTELEIFAKTVIKLGQKHNIPTPYNQVIKEFIEVIENDF